MKNYIVFFTIVIILFLLFYSFQDRLIPVINKEEVKGVIINFALPRERDESVIFPFDFVGYEKDYFVVNAEIIDSLEIDNLIMFAYNLANDLIVLNEEIKEISDIKLKIVPTSFYDTLNLYPHELLIDFNKLTISGIPSISE